jgi:KUP system potassium uptake protein
VSNPFFLMVPQYLTLPLVILSALATVIASQACISGAYSMTSEAILLGFVPRMKVVHTSEREIGQIYVPFINWVLCVIVVVVVLLFRKSDNLAAAYGIAVSSTMLITSVLSAVVMHKSWKWRRTTVTLIVGSFLVVDAGFFASNLSKILEGGWFPLVVASVLFLLMMTWYQGRQLLRTRAINNGIGLEDFIPSLLQHPPHRIEGTSVFLTAHIDFVPPALLHNLKHNKVLHETNLFVTVRHREVPWIGLDKRIEIERLGHDCWQVLINYGFKNDPDVPKALQQLKGRGVALDPMSTSFFLSRDTVVPVLGEGMAPWREKLFAQMHHNASSAADFLNLPNNSVVEMGSKIEI